MLPLVAIRDPREEARGGWRPTTRRIVEGLVVTVVGGSAVAAVVGLANGSGPSGAPDGFTVHGESPPTAGGVSEATESRRDTGGTGSEPGQPVSLRQVVDEEVHVRPGVVAGTRVPPSPYISLAGSQCAASTDEINATLGGRYSDLDLIAALDDESPSGARVALQVLGDGRVLDEAVVEQGTSGTSVSARLDGVRNLSLVMKSRTRSPSCAVEDLQVLLMNGVIS